MHDLWHLRPQHLPDLAAGVSENAQDRMTSGVGPLAYVVVGLMTLPTGLADRLSGWWWLSLAVGLLLYVALRSDRVTMSAARYVLAALFVAAVATYLLATDYAFSAVPMVVVAATAAFLLPLWATLSLVAAQTAALVVAALWSGGGAGIGWASAVMYAVFQVFAVLMAANSLRERRLHEELAETNEELARAQGRLVESSRVAERLRISRDLHDLVGHQLSALALNLEVASHLATGPAGESVAQSRTIAKDLLHDVRQVVGQLREARAELRDALRDMADAVPSPQVHLDLPDDLTRLGTESATAVLRCVQEIITNAMRHADADHLWIAIAYVGGEIVLSARDDGHGALVVSPGNGLV
ncbi:MAG TPA: histidine kinase, partial [Dermatophilaceae bacterium]|nr:histidine kinase [Dermatophilaceae bacterium]